jgi:hypothetical protein
LLAPRVCRIEEFFVSYQFLFLKIAMQVARSGTRALSNPVAGIGKKGDWSGE